jgi:hydroxymethylpyrimidine pyrophosphatase-like HAD family hydrolase
MDRHDTLFRLYEAFDTDDLRANQTFVDLLPPIDASLARESWETAREDVADGKRTIREAFDEAEGPMGSVLAAVAAHADRETAFAALDVYSAHGRPIDALVLDVDETLRATGTTDNEIPRETLALLTKLHDEGMPIVVCTGQTLENVKGFTIQGLGNELVHSGRFSIVYESGNGVFTAGHGADTKRLLYENLDEEIRTVFREVRSGALSAAPEDVRRGCHLQGNEFNVTLKPNFEAGTAEADAVIDQALVHVVDLLGRTVAETVGVDASGADAAAWARAHYTDSDPEIGAVLEAEGALPAGDPAAPETVRALFERIDVGYYEADAAEITSLELDKVAGVEAALEVLGVADPFVLVLGDSKSDLRVMEWAERNDHGIAAAPEHASAAVLDHVRSTSDLVFPPGAAAVPLRFVYALNQMARLDGHDR